MSINHPKMRVNPPYVDTETVNNLAQDCKVSRICAEILYSRGLTDAGAVERFLSADLARDWLDPDEIPGLSEVAERVAEAVREHEQVVIFGDYDVDGVTATAILVRGLIELGIAATPILSHRLEEGYGLSESSIDRIVTLRPDLVITVDTGISSREQIEVLRGHGIDVVVTDHHEPADLIPIGIPLANPKLDPTYGLSHEQGGCGCELAGAGVALKLIQKVGSLIGNPDLWLEYLDLATLGTVADVMPLRGENRALAKAGIEKMRTRPNLGIEMLARSVKLSKETLSAERISYSLAPRINAAGRMGSALDALELLLTDDKDEATRYSELLDKRNKERQEVETALTQSILAQLDETYDGERGIVLAGEGWHDGVKGIVASRIAERYGVPTILCSIEDGMATGSGRSVGEVDLFAALEACATHLTRWGGHCAAVGLALPTEDLDGFRKAYLKYLATLPAEQFSREKVADAFVGLDEISLDLVEEIQSLEPFGDGNPRPALYAPNIQITNTNCVGKDGIHLKFIAVQGETRIPAIQFRSPDIDTQMDRFEMADMTFSLDIDEWQGVRRPNVIVSQLDFLTEPDVDAPDKSEFIAGLFEHAEETITQRDYDGILDAPSFFTKLTGVTFERRQEALAQLTLEDELEMRRDKRNAYDSNACAVYSVRLDQQVGFLNRDLAAVLAPALDEGIDYSIEIGSITGGVDDKAYGLNVILHRADRAEVMPSQSNYRAMQRKKLEKLSARELESTLQRHFIGDNELYPAQQHSLDALEEGTNTLTVMATGRGKSLIFHMHAAKLSILRNTASVFVYPLRALVTDQAYHLESMFADIGLSVAVVTGESSSTARAESFEALRSGQLDVILTTPEFLYFHADKFAASGRVGFIAIDEAHHIGQARAGNRPAYRTMRQTLETLGNPVRLALTATADDEVANAICEALDIHHRVLDRSVRENLHLSDTRNCAQKDSYVLDLARKGEKMVIYVNSRHESVSIARTLRKSIPELAWKCAFYNGGLAQGSRHEIERRFRDGRVQVVVATSAFGEGVNIPDVRHVVLYHMPFSAVEFNQMAGRSGRDNKKATIHLIFGEKDAKINEHILGSLAPPREVCAAIYQVLRGVATLEGQRFQITNEEIAARATEVLRKAGPLPMRLTDKTASVVLGVFRELGFLSTEGRSSARRIVMASSPDKVDLEHSVRYAEGQEEIVDFDDFKQWVLSATASDLRDRFNKPILPSQGVGGAQ
ncbi:MAG: single-stranded-DNA-specific exonuclease RecJ [Coriobacteriia bacterium]|nr:single-stranded-DNA-specific exonuclease RecJ [Coriobacteriia bacterium]